MINKYISDINRAAVRQVCGHSKKQTFNGVAVWYRRQSKWSAPYGLGRGGVKLLNMSSLIWRAQVA